MEMDGSTEVHTRASGGGSTLRLFAALRVGSEVAYDLERHAEVLAARAPGTRVVPAADMLLSVIDFGDVAEEFVPGVAQAIELAAHQVHGAVECALSGSVLDEDGSARGVRVAIDLEVLVSALRDEVLASTAPYAPGRALDPWVPHVTVLHAAAGATLPHAATRMELQPEVGSWLVAELELVAMIAGPLGQHFRRLHGTPFGAQRAEVDA